MSKEERAKEFIKNLGKGKSMVEIEQEESLEDELQMDEKELNFGTICKQYAENKKEIEGWNDKVLEATKDLDAQIKVLSDKRTSIYDMLVRHGGKELQDTRDALKDSILHTFPDEKTVRFDGVGRFTKKILKGIEIVDKDKLLTALVEKKMLSKGVKSFDTTFLKKSKELELFSDEEVKEIEKASLLFVGEKDV